MCYPAAQSIAAVLPVFGERLPLIRVSSNSCFAKVAIGSMEPQVNCNLERGTAVSPVNFNSFFLSHGPRSLGDQANNKLTDAIPPCLGCRVPFYRRLSSASGDFRDFWLWLLVRTYLRYLARAPFMGSVPAILWPTQRLSGPERTTLKTGTSPHTFGTLMTCFQGNSEGSDACFHGRSLRRRKPV